METIDNIVLPDGRKGNYIDHQIVKLLIVLQTFRISYRSASTSLTNHKECLRMICLKEIPSFQTLSRRARMINLHAINREMAFLYSMESIAAVVSFMIHTCKYSIAMRRKSCGKYKDPESI